MANNVAINAGSNVRFLLGTQEKLNTMLTGKTGVNGTFYLTSDTHRLYVGTSDGSVQPVNEGVTTIKNLTALQALTGPNAGEFYYLTDENILCVYNGTSWVQINSDTNTYVNQFSNSVTAVAESGDVDVSTRLVNVNKDGSANKDYSTKTTFKAGNGITLTADSKGKAITIAGVTNKAFSAAAASTDKGTVTLTDSAENTTEFNLSSADADLLKISADGENGLKLTPKDQKLKGAAITGKADGGFTLTINNHDSSNTTADFNPTISYGGTKTSVNFKNGVATLDVYTKAEVDSVFKSANAMTYKGLAGKATGTSLPTGTEFVKWDVSAFVEAGGKHSIGDTYLFAENVTITPTGSQTARTITKGTLAIAKSKGNVEDSNGFIPAANLSWDYVESTSDTDTTYSLNAKDKKVTLVQHGGSNADAGSITFAAGNDISVTVTDGTAPTVTYSHVAHAPNVKPDTAVTQNKASTTSANQFQATTDVTVVSEVTTNAQGHVTEVKTKKVTLVDTNVTPAAMTYASALSTDTKTVNITPSLQLKNAASKEAQPAVSFSNALAMTSDSLSFTGTSGNSVSINLTWGSF